MPDSSINDVTDGAAAAGVTAVPPVTEPPPTDDAPLTKVSAGFISWMTLANFGASMAFVVPLAYSLAVRVDQLAPGREEVLGYVNGVSALVFILISPVLGQWSDRTISRLGRRRPFMIGGALLGIAGLLGIAVAPNVLLVGVGWIVANSAWSTAQNAINYVQADRLPDEQRGKVAGVIQLTSQIAPIIGIGIAYTVNSNVVLLFVVPGIVGALCMLGFLIRGTDVAAPVRVHQPISFRQVFSAFMFRPREAPDFSWNLLGRLVFFIGLYFNTTFGTFFYAQRLDVEVKDVAGTVAVIGALGVVAATAGALAAGILSDRWRRRKLFTLIGALLFGVGATIEAFAHDLPTLVVGAVIMQLSIAAFSVVDQAIVIAVLPNRAEAGRYLSLNVLAQKIPSAVAPLLAPLIIGIGASGEDKNYTLLYLTGGAFALLGGFIILTRVKGVR